MLKWINKKRNQKGFTLVELVVVIAILGILAAIAVPKLSSSREKAAVSSHNANIRTLESAATMAIADGEGDDAKVTWDGSTDDKGLKYVQSWPSVPTLLQGEKAIADDGKDTEISSVPSSYTVEIEKGVITINIAKIKELKAK